MLERLQEVDLESNKKIELKIEPKHDPQDKLDWCAGSEQHNCGQQAALYAKATFGDHHTIVANIPDLDTSDSWYF